MPLPQSKSGQGMSCGESQGSVSGVQWEGLQRNHPPYLNGEADVDSSFFCQLGGAGILPSVMFCIPLAQYSPRSRGALVLEC